MKVKLAIIFGVLIWIISSVLSDIFNPFFTTNVRNLNIVVPIITILVTVFFGILYIRTIDENETIEGFLVGIIFVIIDFICDYVFFIIPQQNTFIIGNQTLHIISITVSTILITTFLGYLAQMTIDLK